MKHLFLDLESTVVTSAAHGFNKCEIIQEHLPIVRKLCSWAEQVNVFSFAIHSDEARARFDRDLKSWIEESIGRTIQWNPNTNEMEAAIGKFMNFRPGPGYFEFTDMVDFYGKEFAFEIYVRRMMSGPTPAVKPGDCCLLLDDTVLQPADKLFRTMRDDVEPVTIMTRSPFQKNLWTYLP